MFLAKVQLYVFIPTQRFEHSDHLLLAKQSKPHFVVQDPHPNTPLYLSFQCIPAACEGKHFHFKPLQMGREQHSCIAGDWVKDGQVLICRVLTARKRKYVRSTSATTPIPRFWSSNLIFQHLTCPQQHPTWESYSCQQNRLPSSSPKTIQPVDPCCTGALPQNTRVFASTSQQGNPELHRSHCRLNLQRCKGEFYRWKHARASILFQLPSPTQCKPHDDCKVPQARLDYRCRIILVQELYYLGVIDQIVTGNSQPGKRRWG